MVRTFLTAALLLGVAPGAALSAQIYVDAGNPNCPGSGTQQDPYCNITTAIVNAVDFDEILVAPGTYVENLDFRGKKIHVRSLEGPLVTTLQANNPGQPVVKFVSGETIDALLEGFTITGGSPGIFARLGTAPVIRGNTITGNKRRDGAGLYLLGSSASIVENVIENNTAEFKGSAIFGVGGAKPLIQSNLIRDNTAGFASIDMINSDPLIANNVIADNWGNGITLASSSRAALVNNTISRNTGTFTGGVGLHFGSSALIANTIIWGNVPSSMYGGGASVLTSNIEGRSFGGQSLDMYPSFNNAPRGDFRLSCNSPCIDAGTSGVPLPRFDLDGEDRVGDGDGDGVPQVDMGSDEFYALLRFQTVPKVGGNKVNFAVHAPPTEAGNTAIVGLSLGTSGIPLPGGRVVPLSPDPLLNAWFALPASLRTMTVTSPCGGLASQSRPFQIPAGFPVGIEVFYSGLTYDANGQIVSIFPARSLVTE